MKLTRQKAIASARSFAGDGIEVIINILQLNYIDDWTKWTDAEGNSLKLKKNGNIKITKSNNPVQKTNDIFIKARPDLIAKHSYWAFVINGGGNRIINFLGNDGVLRSCYYENDNWIKNFSPLLLGIDNLCVVVNNYLDSEHKEIKGIKLPHHKEFVVESCFVTGEIEKDLEI